MNSFCVLLLSPMFWLLGKIVGQGITLWLGVCFFFLHERTFLLQRIEM